MRLGWLRREHCARAHLHCRKLRCGRRLPSREDAAAALALLLFVVLLLRLVLGAARARMLARHVPVQSMATGGRVDWTSGGGTRVFKWKSIMADVCNQRPSHLPIIGLALK